MCMTANIIETARKRQDRSVRRAEEPGHQAMMTQVDGPIYPQPGALAIAR